MYCVVSIYLPLNEATGEEIIVRTVYQIILADYRTNAEQYDNATTRLLDLALQWRANGLDLVADCLTQAAIHVSGGNTIASWRTLNTALDRTRILALSRLGRAPKR